MRTEVIPLPTNENVTLKTYLLDSSPVMLPQVRPAVLIFPGGAYKHVSPREGEPIALSFLAEGYHAFVLRYSVAENAVFPKPLEDAEFALKLIREKTLAWCVDVERIAVCGFSAGGHLAAALGTMGRIRPRALILAYPCILASMSRILAAPIPSLDDRIDAQTPPTFIFATANDDRVPVENSLAFSVALDRAKIPFELHIFQRGVHGISLAKAHTAGGNQAMVDENAAKWMSLCVAWLEKCFAKLPTKDL